MTAFFYDNDGKPCTAAEAVTGEIEEDGVRTYVDLRPYMPEEHDDPWLSGAMASADDAVDPSNADAIKLSWDIRGEIDQEPVDSLAGLITALGWGGLDEATQRTNICGLLELPVWDVAPEDLKRETYDWLVATR